MISALTQALAARGATVGGGHPLAEPGCEVLAGFGDVAGELEALRAGAVVADLSHRGLLALRGRDRGRFLQSMSTADVLKCEVGGGVYGAFLNDKGRVVADASIFVTETELLLDVEAAARELLPPTFDRFIIMDDVEIADLTTERALLAVHGPRAAALVAQVLGEPVDAFAELSHRALGSRRVWRRARFGVPGFELTVPPGEALGLFDALAAAGARPAGAAALEIARVEAGVPRAFVDADQAAVLLEAGLEHVISREKGCYLGQEVIVRAQDRGGIRKRLCGLRVAGEVLPERGTPVRVGEKDVGRITSAVRSPRLGVLALAIAQKDPTPDGAAVQVGALTAEVVPLPFVPEAL